jgi:hypothetical protein
MRPGAPIGEHSMVHAVHGGAIDSIRSAVAVNPP